MRIAEGCLALLMAIRLVVFDIAGTTLKDDHDVTKVFKNSLSKFGYEVPEEQIDPLMGYEKNLAIKRIIEQSQGKEAEQKLVSAVHQEFVSGMIKFYEEEELQVLPNVHETFAALRKEGVKIGINTGFSRDIAQTIIDRLGWEKNEMIDILVASDEVQKGRPEPFMIQSMMRQLRITDPQEIAKVGDTEVDIREGQNARCRYVIGVTTGIFSREELAEYNPTHIVDDVAETLPIVFA